MMMNWRIGPVPTILLATTLLGIAGCGGAPPEEEPAEVKLSYADALAVYNQELAALDRLKAQREELEKSLNPPSLGLVGEVLGQTSELQTELTETLNDLGNPGGAPGEGVDTALVDQLREQVDSATKIDPQKKQEIEAKIVKLDAEIAEQQKRVDRARADKDAAEAER